MPLLFGLFFVSGASGLIFEIVWIRALGLQFGTTTPAIATVLAAFMGGLALGNLLLGPRADRSRSPLALYRRIEVGIGTAGLLVSLLLLRGEGLLRPAASLVAALPDGGATSVARLLIFGSLLLVPTTLMGATMPVMARLLVRAGVPGSTMGRLYAINTAGAVAGVLLPDLLLIPRMGLLATVCVAAAGNFAVAASVGLALRRGRTEEPASPSGSLSPSGSPSPSPAPPPSVVSSAPASAPSHPARRPISPAVPLVLYGVSGFCAMGYQVLWSRMHHHVSMGQVVSFAVLLAVFLVFLTLGSLLATPLADRARRPVLVAAALLAMTGPAAFLPLIGLAAGSDDLNRLLPSIRGVHRAEPSEVLALATASAVWLEAAACTLMGASFPFLAAATVRPGDAGGGTGRLLATNTLGGVVGSVIAGFVLLPSLGAQASLLLLAAIATAVGSSTLLSARPANGRFRMVAAASTLLVVGCALAVPRDLLGRSWFAAFHGADTRIEALTEGPTTTAAVARRHRFGQPAYLQLLTPGVTMSDTQLGARRYMGLMGHLPMAMSENAQDALLICFGVGNTARSVLSWPTLQQLDVVDIAQEVTSSSPRFAEVHGGVDPLTDPRVVVRHDDGRQHLSTTDRRYDVITSEPPPPTDAGVVNLYTREFYVAAKGALKPGGVIAQWLPIFQLTREETRAIVAAFVAELPHVALFYGYGHQWILVGSDRPLPPDALPGPQWGGLQLPTVAADLRSIAADPETLGAEWLQNDAGLRESVFGAAPLTDDRPSLQYPERGLAGRVEVPPGLVAPGRPMLRGLGARSLRDPLERERAFFEAFGARLRAHPDDRHAQSLVRIGEDWAEPARAHVAAGGSDPDALLVLARRDLYAGRLDEAAERLRSIDPDAVGPGLHAFLTAAAEGAAAELPTPQR